MKFKSSIADNTNNYSIENVKIVVRQTYSSNVYKTIEIPLINCVVTLDLNWSEKCVICEANRATTFAKTSEKFYVPLVTLQLKIMQNYYSNPNQGLKEQSIGINISQKNQQRPKIDI